MVVCFRRGLADFCAVFLFFGSSVRELHILFATVKEMESRDKKKIPPHAAKVTLMH